MTYDDDFAEEEETREQAAASQSGRVLVGSDIAGQHEREGTDDLLHRVADVIESARPMPLSSSAMVNKEELLDLVHEAIDTLPDEVREARWLLKEREEYLAKMRVDGDEILGAARARSERMVQRTEVVKAAEHRARRIREGAEADARRMRRECEDFCDQKLASFEIVLERTLKLVASGRDKLRSTSPSAPEPDPAPDPAAAGFFDQDQ
ncbi:MAG: hypothetical protein M3Z46_08610 [Actinomycetota bacterium]|nr:hypothetical protein [Actinomycetota bacterium]